MNLDHRDVMAIPCCENDGQGGSRLTETSAVLHPKTVVEGENPFLASWSERALAVKFVEIPLEASESGWHPAPCRQYVIVLGGQLKVESSDGGTRNLGPGDVILAADTDGLGHRATVTDGPARLMFVSLADSPAITVDF